ncbi:vacuolar-type H+-ATPase subunit I/STV1 [Geomicrobium halophilum]|uniref:Vacuolar-type H+-ATPase subunit I/STV1 n=1 Tax=Geomicrobium halophilum TaxID=549000 RepID=A0A841PL65_9BACL|nr:hypothetical protein [Geomicrobium halophilum]MBB6449597.1 vacuolar-type H+-ATPase subunit I/STV1 [Geomicrobium halophilum]
MEHLPEAVQNAIKEYQDLAQTRTDAVDKQAERIDELTQELEQEKAKLQRLMDETIANPTAENEKKEAQSRKKVGELELNLNGAQERKKRGGSLKQSEQREAAVKAVQVAKEASDEKFREGIDQKMQAIESAKMAYLHALADYKSFKKECENIVGETGRRTNENAIEQVGRARAAYHEPSWNYNGDKHADGVRYTVQEHEMNYALRTGDVIADGRVH